MNPDQLRVSIEMGDDYEPSERLRGALEELRAALAETDHAEVEGFLVGDDPGTLFRSMQFDTMSARLKVGNAGYKDQISPTKNVIHKW